MKRRLRAHTRIAVAITLAAICALHGLTRARSPSSVPMVPRHIIWQGTFGQAKGCHQGIYCWMNIVVARSSLVRLMVFLNPWHTHDTLVGRYLPPSGVDRLMGSFREGVGNRTRLRLTIIQGKSVLWRSPFFDEVGQNVRFDVPLRSAQRIGWKIEFWNSLGCSCLHGDAGVVTLDLVGWSFSR
jgi:hypothetical protein